MRFREDVVNYVAAIRSTSPVGDSCHLVTLLRLEGTPCVGCKKAAHQLGQSHLGAHLSKPPTDRVPLVKGFLAHIVGKPGYRQFILEYLAQPPLRWVQVRLQNPPDGP